MEAVLSDIFFGKNETLCMITQGGAQSKCENCVNQYVDALYILSHNLFTDS